MATRRRRTDFDLIRIFACLAILMIHFNASVSGFDQSGQFLFSNGIVPNYYFGCVYLGEIGNCLFFLLSGASLMLRRESGQKKENNPFFFWLKRAKALYPTFWIAYLGATCVHLLHYRWLSDAPWKKLFWSILGMDGYAVSIGWSAGEFYQIGEWYLGCILLCYLFWPLVVCLWDKLPTALFLGGTVIAYIAAVQISNGSSLTIMTRLCEMIAGGCFSRYFQTTRNRKLLGGSIFFALFCICGQNILHLHAITVSLAVCWAFFVGCAWIVECMPTVFSALAPALMKLAGLTYPLFLVHHKLIIILASLFNLDCFPYRYTIVLFVAYLATAVFLAYWLKRASKRCISVLEKLWIFCKNAQSQKKQAPRPEQ